MSRLLKPHEIEAVPNSFDFFNPPADPIEIAHTLAQEVIKHEFISLAANQIGLRHRALAIRCNPVIVAFNPILLAEGEQNETMTEGCGSYPGLMLEVTRPRMIRVRYTQPNGEITAERYSGLTARYFLQSLDLLDGVHFTSLVNRYHLEKSKKRAKKS